uniref:Uncharacterized protein n=1 Tax=Arundo donax TaxID=35708 RepID=A0A0A9G1A9_ARUDO
MATMQAIATMPSADDLIFP